VFGLLVVREGVIGMVAADGDLLQKGFFLAEAKHLQNLSRRLRTPAVIAAIRRSEVPVAFTANKHKAIGSIDIGIGEVLFLSAKLFSFCDGLAGTEVTCFSGCKRSSGIPKGNSWQ